ncbi:hypothetical protein, partial [Actinoplanes sp. NPDC051851]|uniref:hypothetical protein n=1 Tax=Actinoplanes sp. NPDC051851 TaxID=3154753 RepID=UPI003421632C
PSATISTGTGTSTVASARAQRRRSVVGEDLNVYEIEDGEIYIASVGCPPSPGSQPELLVTVLPS